MTEPTYPMDMSEEYRDMDIQFFDTYDPTKALEQPLDYGYHELAPQLERGGWMQLRVGYVPIGRREGGFKQMIVPRFHDHRYSDLNGFYFITEGEDSGTPLSSANYESAEEYATRDERTYTFYIKWFPSLGDALDAVRDRSALRGLQRYTMTDTPGQGTIFDPSPPPDGFYPMWIDYWFATL